MSFGVERRALWSRGSAWRPGRLCPGSPVRRGDVGVASTMLFLGMLLTLVFDGVPAAAGQDASDKEIATQDVQSPFKVEVQRNMVIVRVIVRDASGRPVPSLRKEDFRLFDNSKPQEIDQFAFESSNGASPLPRPIGGEEKEPEEEGAPAATAVNTTARNFLALYFDDLQMSFEDIVHARDAADRYMAAKLTPADRAGIFTSSGQGNLDFTDDRSKLHEALFKLRSRPLLSSGTNTCPDIGAYQAYLIVYQRDPSATAIATQEAIQCNCQLGSSAAQQSCASQVASFVPGEATRMLNQWETLSEAVLRGLEQVIRRTAILPGQHNVIFLSPGFLRYNLESQIGAIADRALRSGVVIGALDPRGLYVIIPGGDASQSSIAVTNNAQLTGDKARMIQDGYSQAEDVLYDFATTTGGQFFHNNNDLDAGFRQVGTLSDVYYVLAFSPRALKFDGRFHKLKVSLANPRGYTIQARRGYFAPKASEDAAAKAKEEIQQALYSQDELKELPVDVHTQFYRINDAQARLSVLTHLDMSAVRFRKEQDRNLNNLTFVTVLFDRDGKYVMGKEKRVEFRLRDATLARLTQTGITLKVEFDLTPGTYLVRQVVRDSEAGQLSGLNRTVEIPY